MANEIKPIGSTDISAIGTVVGNLMNDLRQIIDEARIHVASTANYELTMMYWHIGERINRDVLEMNEQHTESKLCRKWRHNCLRAMSSYNRYKSPLKSLRQNGEMK